MPSSNRIQPANAVFQFATVEMKAANFLNTPPTTRSHSRSGLKMYLSPFLLRPGDTPQYDGGTIYYDPAWPDRYGFIHETVHAYLEFKGIRPTGLLDEEAIAYISTHYLLSKVEPFQKVEKLLGSCDPGVGAAWADAWQGFGPTHLDIYRGVAYADLGLGRHIAHSIGFGGPRSVNRNVNSSDMAAASKLFGLTVSCSKLAQAYNDEATKHGCCLVFLCSTTIPMANFGGRKVALLTNSIYPEFY